MVSVPVLSLLITVVPPSVSTSVSDLTTALDAARRCAPDDSIAVTNVGSPVGMEAMPVEMQSSSSVSISWPRAMPTIAMMLTADQARIPNTLVIPSSSSWSGERVRLVAVTMVAMRPISVPTPVAVTTNVADPRVTCVFWNTMFVRSPRATSSPSTVAVSLPTGADSPVSAASCTSSVADVRRRPSPGTSSPASIRTTSPGTSFADSTSWTVPSRRTRARATWSPSRASTLARALSSWLEPMTTLNVTSPTTTSPVATWPIRNEATPTMSSMMFIGLRSCSLATCNRLGGGSVGSSFVPYLASRDSTSAAARPWSGSTSSSAATSPADLACHASRAATSTLIRCLLIARDSANGSPAPLQNGRQRRSSPCRGDPACTERVGHAFRQAGPGVQLAW